MSNPAARLHAILLRAHSTEVPSNSTPQAWKQILQLPPETDPLTVMAKVARLYELPDLIAKEIARFPDLEQELFLGWRSDLTKAFEVIGFTAGFDQFKTRLSNSLLMNIRFCSHELEKRLPEKEVSPEELAAIRAAAANLYDEVVRLDLPPDIFRFLLDHLWLIITAVDNYEITGASGLQLSIDAVIGAVVTEPEISQDVKNTPIGKKFWSTVVARVAVALKLAKAALELADEVAKHLPPPS